MIVTFDEVYQENLYKKGETGLKKFRFQPQVVRGYQKAVKYLIQARCKEDLFPFKSLHFEALHGDKEGRFSVMARIQNISENKIANNMTSSELIHPGEMIKDEIMARGLTQKELAQKMGVSYTVFNEILNGKRPVTTEYALLLEAALGTNANIWLGLQADYNMQIIKQDKSFMKKLEKIRKIAAIF